MLTLGFTLAAKRDAAFPKGQPIGSKIVFQLGLALIQQRSAQTVDSFDFNATKHLRMRLEQTVLQQSTQGRSNDGGD
jgi:hypothetical protein